MKKVLLDTDIGCDIDDALSLTYLLKKPDCSLLGITTVSGEVYLRAELCSAICKHEKKEKPIYTGQRKPLVICKEAEFPQQSERLNLWQHDSFFEDGAVEYLKKTIEENPHEITLIAIGPLTNIALLFAMYPHTAELIKELFIMGGKYFGEEQLEWNIKFDPHAAQIVFAAAVPKLVIAGLDVTLSFALFQKEMNSYLTNAPLISQLADDWYKDISDRIYFHDPLAVALAFDESIATYEKGSASMNMKTYCTNFATDIKKHTVAKSVDVNKFYKEFFGTLNS